MTGTPSAGLGYRNKPVPQWNNKDHGIHAKPDSYDDYYKDTGCEASSSCLACPLPDCMLVVVHGKLMLSAEGKRLLALMQAKGNA